MLGLLLARAGVAVLVLEKHRDFLRDFRGDTIHPATLQIMHELGLIRGLSGAARHQEVRELRGIIGQSEIRLADFTHPPRPRDRAHPRKLPRAPPSVSARVPDDPPLPRRGRDRASCAQVKPGKTGPLPRRGS